MFVGVAIWFSLRLACKYGFKYNSLKKFEKQYWERLERNTGRFGIIERCIKPSFSMAMKEL